MQEVVIDDHPGVHSPAPFAHRGSQLIQAANAQQKMWPFNSHHTMLIKKELLCLHLYSWYRFGLYQHTAQQAMLKSSASFIQCLHVIMSFCILMDSTQYHSKVGNHPIKRQEYSVHASSYDLDKNLVSQDGTLARLLCVSWESRARGLRSKTWQATYMYCTWPNKLIEN